MDENWFGFDGQDNLNHNWPCSLSGQMRRGFKVDHRHTIIVVFGGGMGFQRFPSFCSLYSGGVTRMVFNVKMAIILFENMPGALVLGDKSSGQCCYNIAGFIDNTFMIIFDHTSIMI